MATELQQTKGSVRIEGKIVGFDPSDEKSYRDGETKNGRDYRSISTAVKTSNTNIIYNLDLFGQVPDKKVKIFSNKGGEKKNLEIDFDDRDFANGEYEGFPDGFTCFGFGTVGAGFDKENGKLKMKNYFNYDGVEIIKDKLENDNSVWIDATFNINTYDSNGETKTNVKYTIDRIGRKDDIDFDAENFKEVASFEQEMVVVHTEFNKDTNRLYVTGRIINFNKTWKDMTFVVDTEKYNELAKNIYKKCKFGDLLTVQGKIINGTILVEAPEEESIDWGGETPEGVDRKMNRNKVSEFQITNVKKHTAKIYKESDFIVEDAFFSGGAIDISDDMLPF